VCHPPTAEMLDHLVAAKPATRMPLDDHGQSSMVLDVASSYVPDVLTS
jgi:hypothetical protein